MSWDYVWGFPCHCLKTYLNVFKTYLKGKLKFLCKVGGLPFLNRLWFVLKIKLRHALPSEYPAHVNWCKPVNSTWALLQSVCPQPGISLLMLQLSGHKQDSSNCYGLCCTFRLKHQYLVLHYKPRRMERHNPVFLNTELLLLHYYGYFA